MTRLNAVVTATALITTLLIVGCQDKKQEQPAPQTPQVMAPPPPFPHEQIPESSTAEPADHTTARTEPEAVETAEEPITTITPKPAPTRTTNKKATTAAKPKEKYAPAQTKQRTYVVKKGDTLQEISQQFYGTTKNWRKIADANKLKDPNKLTVGTKLVIP